MRAGGSWFFAGSQTGVDPYNAGERLYDPQCLLAGAVSSCSPRVSFPEAAACVRRCSVKKKLRHGLGHLARGRQHGRLDRRVSLPLQRSGARRRAMP
jgi:hypothetical protein